jgi:hypothetical protein
MLESASVLEEQSLATPKSAKKRAASDTYSELLLKSAKSIDSMASCIVSRNASASKDDDDDDWLYTRRLYLKLKKIPDGSSKDRLKLKLETELLNAMDPPSLAPQPHYPLTMSDTPAILQTVSQPAATSSFDMSTLSLQQLLSMGLLASAGLQQSITHSPKPSQSKFRDSCSD